MNPFDPHPPDLDLHRFLAGTAVAFTGLHLVGLVADNYVGLQRRDRLVPFAASWIEEAGVSDFLDELAVELAEGAWRPRPVRRVEIPKPLLRPRRGRKNLLRLLSCYVGLGAFSGQVERTPNG